MTSKAFDNNGHLVSETVSYRVIGINIVWGCPQEPVFLTNLPADCRVRFRFRADDWCRAFVKTKSEISEHYIEISQDGTYQLSDSVRRNIVQNA